MHDWVRWWRRRRKDDDDDDVRWGEEVLLKMVRAMAWTPSIMCDKVGKMRRRGERMFCLFFVACLLACSLGGMICYVMCVGLSVGCVVCVVCVCEKQEDEEIDEVIMKNMRGCWLGYVGMYVGKIK